MPPSSKQLRMRWHERWHELPLTQPHERVHKTLLPTKSFHFPRLGTNPNGIWREGDQDAFSLDGAPCPQVAPLPTLPYRPILEEHISLGFGIVARPQRAWPGRQEVGGHSSGHNVPPAPACVPRGLRTDDIAGSAPRLHGSRLLSTTLHRRHFRDTNYIDDIAGTRSVSTMPPLGVAASGTLLLASTGGEQFQRAGAAGPRLLTGSEHAARISPLRITRPVLLCAGHWRAGTRPDHSGSAGMSSREGQVRRLKKISSLPLHMRSTVDEVIFGRDLDYSREFD